jgi:hypothetical protein
VPGQAEDRFVGPFAFWQGSATWKLSRKKRSTTGIAGCMLRLATSFLTLPHLASARLCTSVIPPNGPLDHNAEAFLCSFPDEEFEDRGGKLRVIAVEFYDSAVAIRWRVSPQPNIASVFPEETAALEQDLIGLEEWATEDLRRRATNSWP